jgi:hypothetical protein
MTETHEKKIDPRLDAHIRRTLREVAHAVAPASTTDLLVLPRRRPGRHRRTAAVAAGVVALSGLAGAVALAGAGRDDPPAAQLGLGSDADVMNAAPQRLFLAPWWGELRPDGTPVRLELAGLEPHGAPQPLPHGGYVVVGVHPVEDPPEGFDEETDLAYELVVVGADGEVETERQIAPSTLVGATPTEAVLRRDGRGATHIVTHDLETGRERVLTDEPSTLEEESESGTYPNQSALVGNTLVSVEPDYRETGLNGDPLDGDGPFVATDHCQMEVVDLVTGDRDERQLRFGCDLAEGVEASPDGRHLAVVYEPTRAPADGPFEVRFAVVRLDGGAVATDQSLSEGGREVGYLGMAWQDDATVKVALLDAAANPDWNFDVDPLERDDLIVEDRTVR